MSPNTENTTSELTEEDLAAVAASLAEGTVEPLDHTILKIWTEILSNVETAQAERVSPVVAQSVLSNWDRMGFEDLQLYWELYHRNILGYRQVLRDVLKDFPEAIDQVEDDAEQNREVYFTVITEWSRYARVQERAWDSSERHAGTKLAALLDASKFFFGPMGIIQHLMQPQVGFEWGEADQLLMEEKLSEEATGE